MPPRRIPPRGRAATMLPLAARSPSAPGLTRNSFRSSSTATPYSSQTRRSSSIFRAPPTAPPSPTVRARARSSTMTRGAVAGTVSINDVTITEGNSGTQIMNFTVTRFGGTAAVTVNYATAANTASGAGGDYIATGGTLSFGAGVNSQLVSVTINGDTVFEPNETFFLNLTTSSPAAPATTASCSSG